MKKFASIATCVLACLGIGVLAELGCGRNPQDALLLSPPPNGTSITIEVDANSIAPVKDVLVKRFAACDERFFWEQLSGNRARIVVASGDSQKLEWLKKMVSRRGQLEFRLVHPDNDALIAQNETPPGYQLVERDLPPPSGQEVQLPPGTVMSKVIGQPEHHTEKVLIKNTSEPGLSGNIVKQTGVGSDSLGRQELMFQLTPEASSAFAEFTRQNIGRRIALMVDGEFYSAPKVMSTMTSGSGVIDGSFEPEEVRILSIILSSPLPVDVKLVEAK